MNSSLTANPLSQKYTPFERDIRARFVALYTEHAQHKLQHVDKLMAVHIQKSNLLAAIEFFEKKYTTVVEPVVEPFVEPVVEPFVEPAVVESPSKRVKPIVRPRNKPISPKQVSPKQISPKLISPEVIDLCESSDEEEIVKVNKPVRGEKREISAEQDMVKVNKLVRGKNQESSDEEEIVNITKPARGKKKAEAQAEAQAEAEAARAKLKAGLQDKLKRLQHEASFAAATTTNTTTTTTTAKPPTPRHDYGEAQAKAEAHQEVEEVEVPERMSRKRKFTSPPRVSPRSLDKASAKDDAKVITKKEKLKSVENFRREMDNMDVCEEVDETQTEPKTKEIGKERRRRRTKEKEKDKEKKKAPEEEKMKKPPEEKNRNETKSPSSLRYVPFRPASSCSHSGASSPVEVPLLRCGYTGFQIKNCQFVCRTQADLERHRLLVHVSAEDDAVAEQDRLLNAAKERVRYKKEAEAAAAAAAAAKRAAQAGAVREVAFVVPADVGIPNTQGPVLPADHWKYESLYGRLGLPEGSHRDLVKAHFRKLALRYHPDRVTGVAEKFQGISDAYLALMK
jgi:hypothetical protein